jgi:hypothetical protein
MLFIYKKKLENDKNELVSLMETPIATLTNPQLRQNVVLSHHFRKQNIAETDKNFATLFDVPDFTDICFEDVKPMKPDVIFKISFFLKTETFF